MTVPKLDTSHILAGSPLRRPGFVHLTALAVFVALVFAVAMVLRIPLGMRPDVLNIYLTALGVAAVISLFPLTILWFLDRRERESAWLFVAAFLWGALLATGLALPINSLILGWVRGFVGTNPQLQAALGENAALMIGAPIAGPLVEEVTKGLGVLLLFALLRGEFDNMRDGLIYGALVGLGFTWLESSLYIARGYAEYGVAPWNFQFGYRYALFGLSGHPLYTALFGAFLGLSRQVRARWLRWLLPPVGLFLAIAAHALNNGLGLLLIGITGRPPPAASAEEIAAALTERTFVQAWLQFSLMQLVIFLPFVAIGAVALWRSGRWERRVISEELASEAPPVVLPEEQEAIRRDGMFRTRRIARLDRHRSTAIVRAQHELAFRKRHVRAEGGDPEADALVNSWRSELARQRETGASHT
ncbi:MAG TPA: PrsW family intramembrane metalloprotease [Chloroflexaceae bacterium]|nr:PrsW family intramembrane metalloprotease [Chloroflexaceae bacterium]